MKKLEKILTIVSTTDCIVEGKITLGDIGLLSLYMLYIDKNVNLGDFFQQEAPSAKKIIDKLLEDKKIADLVEEQKAAYPYFPL